MGTVILLEQIMGLVMQGVQGVAFLKSIVARAQAEGRSDLNDADMAQINAFMMAAEKDFGDAVAEVRRNLG